MCPFVFIFVILYIRQTDNFPTGPIENDEGKLSIKEHATALDLWIDKLPLDQQTGARKLHAEWSRRSAARETKLSNDLEIVRDDAAYFEFVLCMRSKSEEFENLFIIPLKHHLGFNVDRDFKDYEQLMRNFFKENYPPEFAVGKHYRRWILTLHFGDDSLSPQLYNIRKALKNDRELYHKYAMSMERLYGIYSNDFHGKFLNLKYFDKLKIPAYLKALPDDLKLGITVFINSEEEKISTK